MSDPVTIANLLGSTLTSVNQTIKNAQKALTQLQSDPNFLPHLLLITKQGNLPKNVRKAAAIYTRQFAKNILLEKDQTKINRTAQLILNAIAEAGIQLGIRRHLASTLQYLLSHDQKQIIREIFHTHCIKIIQTAKNQSDSNVNFEFIGFFSQILMSSFVNLTKEINIFIQNSISLFCELNLRVFKHVVQALNQQSKEKTMQMFRLLKLYSYTFKVYLKKMILAELSTLQYLYGENLALLLSTSFNFMLANNQLSTPLIFYNASADPDIVDIFHSIKADYIESVFYMMRAIMLQFKDTKMIQANAVISNAALIPSFIKALFQLFKLIPYDKIKSQSLVKLVEEIINCQIISVRNSFYFSSYQEYREVIMHGFVFKVLAFSPIDYQMFTDDPNQFINQLLQIIEMDSEEYMKEKRGEEAFKDNYDEIQEYSTLKTLTATFLEAYCKHIDGSLTDILTFSTAVLKNQVKTTFSKSLILMMISIMRNQVIAQQGDHCSIIPVVSDLLKNREIPGKINDAQDTPTSLFEENIQYLMLLLTVFRYISLVKEVSNNDMLNLYDTVCKIITKQSVSQAIHYEALDLIISISERQPQCQLKFIEILNQIISNRTINRNKSLQTLQQLFKIADKQLENHLQVVILTVQNLVDIIEKEVKSKNLRNQLVINLSWNVIGHIVQSQVFIPKLIKDIQAAIMPLLPYIDGESNYDYEENIFILMSSFISKSKTVTQNELIMFEIIPKLFYTQYEHRFGHAFETLHMFIYYGNVILASAPQAIKSIIDMAVCNMNTTEIKNSHRNQAENCEGVLILQSLILSCGNAFSSENWMEITKALTKRLENPPVKGHILRSNILAALALIVMIGHKFFSVQDCDILLNTVLQNHYCFVVKYSIKLAIIALSQILCLYNLPFVANRFTYILDTILNMLQAQENTKLFNTNPITDEQKDYDVSLQSLYNMTQNMDEIEHFKTKLTYIKQQNPALLQQTISELPEKKEEYLRKTMNIQKIMNQNRVIFKIKR